MEEKQNWLSIGAVVLVIAGLGIFLYRQSQQQAPQTATTPDENQVAQERADQLLETLNVELPDDAQRVNLRDVTGGESAGVATRREEDGVTTQSLLVALPDPQVGQFYEAYMVKDDSESEPLYLGKLRSVKGGWLLDYTLTEEMNSYTTVRVTRESSDDKKAEEVVMEGTFEDLGTPDEESEEAPSETDSTDEAN